MSTYIMINRKPVYTIEVDHDDGCEYEVPHWANGVKMDSSR
jgi:hypothetical protein